MNYLIDTNCLIYYFNESQEYFCDWFDKLEEKNIYISNLIVFELLSGFYVKQNRRGLAFVSKICELYNVLDSYTLEQASLSAANYSSLRKKEGITLNSLDLHIASQAINNNLTLVTFNKKDFEPLQQFGLKLKCFEFEKESSL